MAARDHVRARHEIVLRQHIPSLDIFPVLKTAVPKVPGDKRLQNKQSAAAAASAPTTTPKKNKMNENERLNFVNTMVLPDNTRREG
jgi:hypothetical protein